MTTTTDLTPERLDELARWLPDDYPSLPVHPDTYAAEITYGELSSLIDMARESAERRRPPMTDRTMPPVGPEMDALVVAALGCPELHYAEPSRCIGDAVWAIEEWRKQHPDRWWIVNSPAAGIETFIATLGNGRVGMVTAEAPTLEAAICEAIIRVQWALEDA